MKIETILWRAASRAKSEVLTVLPEFLDRIAASSIRGTSPDAETRRAMAATLYSLVDDARRTVGLVSWAAHLYLIGTHVPPDIPVVAEYRPVPRDNTRRDVAWLVERLISAAETAIQSLPRDSPRSEVSIYLAVSGLIHLRKLRRPSRNSGKMQEATPRRPQRPTITILSDAEWKAAVKLLRREIFSRELGFFSTTGTLGKTAEGIVGHAISRAVSHGQMQAVEANSDLVDTIEWVAVIDEANEKEPEGDRVSDCRSRDGLTREQIEERYGVFVPPPLHINCRCATTLHIRSWELVAKRMRSEYDRPIEPMNAEEWIELM